MFDEAKSVCILTSEAEFVCVLKFALDRSLEFASACGFCGGCAAIKSRRSSKFALFRSFGFTPACDSTPSRSFKFKLVPPKFKLFGASVLKSASLGFISFKSTPTCAFTALDKFALTFAAAVKFDSALVASEKFDSATAAARYADGFSCSVVAPSAPHCSKF